MAEAQAPASPEVAESVEGELVATAESRSTDNGPVSPQVHEMCRDMFEKTTEYLQGELLSTGEEYLLLEKLNKMTTAKYSDMSSLSRDLTGMMDELNEKYRNLQPYLDQIDQLDESVGALEKSAYQLDNYSKKLEAKLRQLDRR
ncbi:biogenesis of lysosome-related organelles complex 1 subunit 2-like [Sycon ciliatum]|uniref:biogenesis of lysosome-related organelles complex 1 subunit 2-like n=1 Tax=Sycon ciliatum TaxID=27933 RepID=UPI0020A85306|eukprot:scpid92375/ scgid8113/ Biogenesis of lysosome-related organelles complex 1 subunit 2